MLIIVILLTSMSCWAPRRPYQYQARMPRAFGRLARLYHTLYQESLGACAHTRWTLKSLGAMALLLARAWQALVLQQAPKARRGKGPAVGAEVDIRPPSATEGQSAAAQQEPPAGSTGERVAVGGCSGTCVMLV
jgi:hypothetical protein